MVDNSGEVPWTIACGTAEDAFRQPQQPQGQEQRQPQQQQQQQHYQQQYNAPERERYKSCDFCARRKRKCSGDLPRCRLCVEKKQPHCHYRLKPLVIPRPLRPSAAQRKLSSIPTSSLGTLGGKWLAGVDDFVEHVSEGSTTVTGTRAMGMAPGSTSLKRCRLSPSPATGLVGMQENSFLGDFFGCLGILPLATESTIRLAMVDIMARAMAQRQPDEDPWFRNGRFTIGESCALGTGAGAGAREGAGAHSSKGEEGGWRGALVRGGAPDSPAKCIMWCAVALGALMKGSPVEFVKGYIGLARKSLAECFDGSSVENARAYLIMSFLHGIMGDEEKSEKYLSFTMTIVTKLGPDELPKELKGMLLVVEKMTIFQTNDRDIEKHSIAEYCEKLVDLPQVGDAMHQEDVCNFVLSADRRLRQAFFVDVRSNRDSDNAEGAKEEGRRASFGGVVQEQSGGSSVAALGLGVKACDKEPELSVVRAPQKGVKRCRHGPEPPIAGSARKDHIRQALPELSRLSRMLKKSDSSSIAGLVFHANIAYMKCMLGDLHNVYAHLEVCIDVFVRYPGVVRFRPHLVHCILSGCHEAGERKTYDTLRSIFNSVLPEGFKPAPPFQEWTDLPAICDHVFCRTAQGELDELPQNEEVSKRTRGTGRGEVSGDPIPHCSSSSHKPSPAGGDLRSSGVEVSSVGTEPSSAGACLSRTSDGTHGSGSSATFPTSESETSSSTMATTNKVASCISVQREALACSYPLQQFDTMTGKADHGEKDVNLRLLMETSAPTTESQARAAPAPDVDANHDGQVEIDWPRSGARGAITPAGAPTPRLEVFEGEPASTEGDIHLTDADLLDVITTLMAEE